MGSLLNDLGYGFRMIRRSPGFAVIAILTLSLSIGAATSVFSVVEAVLLRPLPFAHQERLMVLWEVAENRDAGHIELSYPNYRDWRDQNKVFSQLAALTSSNSGMNLTGAGEPRQVQAAPVSGNFFATLRVKPQLGRAFLPEDDRLGTQPVLVLGDRLWREQFGGDRHIVGRQLRLDAQSYTVVGVMPAGFKYPRDAELWIPQLPVLGQDSEQRIFRVLKAIGRLKPGVSLEQARSDMAVITGRLAAQYDANHGTSASIAPLAEEIVGDSRSTLLLLLAGVLFLLLIAVANVANLLLARTLERRHEIGVRAALGAARGRVIRQLLTEGLALCLLGATGGLLVAALGIRALRSLAPASIPRIDEIGLSPSTLLFTLLVSLLAVAIFGTVPALHAGRDDLHELLKAGSKRVSGSSQGSRLSRLLVRSEVSLALVLLIGAGLTIQSMVQLRRMNPGFAPENVLTARIQLPAKTYPDVHQRQLFFDRLRDRAAALPGVVSAATVLARPLDDSSTWEVPITFEGQSQEAREKNPNANFQAISPGYFHTLGIRLIKGRDFDAHDAERSQLVAIVSKGLGEQFWPGQDPIGKRVRRTFRGPSDQKMPWLSVVGVADDVNYRGWGQLKPDLYVPFPQNPLAGYMTYQDLVIHTRIDPLSLSRPLRETVYALDPNQSIASIVSLEDLVDRVLAVPRFTLQLMTIFGVVALALAAVGIYGLLSYTVGQRSREIGIRMALGARRQEIVRMVIGEGLKLTAGGLVAGILAALALTRLMTNLLPAVSILDPLTFVSVPLFLALVALLATFIPALRAARSDPNKVLRS